MTQEIGDNGNPLAFVVLEVDVGDLDKAARMTMTLVLIGDLRAKMEGKTRASS